MTIPNSTVSNTNSFYTQVTAPQKTLASEPITKQPQEIQQPQQEIIKAPQEFKPTFFDKISEKVVNPRDISDTVKVPRAIFKGYLGIMFGTTFITLSTMAKNMKKLSTTLGVIGLGLSAAGTFEFVKPFLLKPKDDKNQAKAETETAITAQTSHTA